MAPLHLQTSHNTIPHQRTAFGRSKADAGYQIFLNFTTFNIEGMKTECAYDYVKIGESEKLCGEYCKIEIS
ncbi:hypothetical protein COOONC_23193 [Cooperia oncophora]